MLCKPDILKMMKQKEEEQAKAANPVKEEINSNKEEKKVEE